MQINAAARYTLRQPAPFLAQEQQYTTIPNSQVPPFATMPGTPVTHAIAALTASPEAPGTPTRRNQKGKIMIGLWFSFNMVGLLLVIIGSILLFTGTRLHEGARLKLHSLPAELEYNGKSGTLIAFDAE